MIVLNAAPVLMIATVIFAIWRAVTLGGGETGILGVALTGQSEGSVVAHNDVGEHTFVLVASGAADDQKLTLSTFKRVLPERYTWLGTSEMQPGTGSRFQYSITAWNPSVGDLPLLVVWGANQTGASDLRVTGNGINATLGVGPVDYFVVGVAFDPDPAADSRDDFGFAFSSSDGTATAFRHVTG